MIESYQPKIATSAAVGGGSSFTMYGSNDNSNWTEIGTYLACKRGTEGAWYNQSMTTHITRITDGDYNISQYLYIKLTIQSYLDWCCVGVQKFYS